METKTSGGGDGPAGGLTPCIYLDPLKRPRIGGRCHGQAFICLLRDFLRRYRHHNYHCPHHAAPPPLAPPSPRAAHTHGIPRPAPPPRAVPLQRITGLLGCLGVQRPGPARTLAAPPRPPHQEDRCLSPDPSRWREAPARGRRGERPASAAQRRGRNRLKQTLQVPGAARAGGRQGAGCQPPAWAGVECQNLCVNFVCICFDVPLRNGTSYGDHRDGSGV